MGKSVRGHIRHNVIGYVALFVALSGTAYAVNGPLAGRNTVGSADIINNEVKSSDVGAGAVGTGDVADDSTSRALTGDDIAADALTGDDIAEGTLEEVGAGLMLGHINDLGGAGTVFATPSGFSTASAALTDVNARIPVGLGAVAVRLVAQVTGPNSLSAGQTRTFTLHYFGNPTDLTCTVDENFNQCQDFTNAAPFGSVGNLAMRVVSAGAGLTTTQDASFGYDVINNTP